MLGIEFQIWDAETPAPERLESTRASIGPNNSLQSVRLLRAVDYPREWTAVFSFPEADQRLGFRHFAWVAMVGYIDELGRLESEGAEVYGRLNRELMSLALSGPTTKASLQIGGDRVDAQRIDVGDFGWILASDDERYATAVAGFHVDTVPSLSRAREDLWGSSIDYRIRQLRQE